MDWNVVVTAYDWRGLRSARRLLSGYGEVARTEFHNVLVLRVADVAAFLESISAAAEHDLSMRNDIARIIPAQAAFAFATTAEFQEKAGTIARQWADRMPGKSFHVRLHRRRGGSPVPRAGARRRTGLPQKPTPLGRDRRSGCRCCGPGHRQALIFEPIKR